MALQVRLGDKDRAEFGCDEWLGLDWMDVTVEELETVCAETGIDTADWPEVMVPKIPFEDVGKPDAKERQPAWFARVVVWLALRQSGLDVTWAQAGKVRVTQIKMRSVEPPKDGESPARSDSPSSD